MREYPRIIGTRQDVVNLLNDPDTADRVKEDLQRMIDARFAWVVSGELGNDDPGCEDDTHKVIVEEQDGKEVRVQMELSEDPMAQIFRIGLTVAEAEVLIQDKKPNLTY